MKANAPVQLYKRLLRGLRLGRTARIKVSLLVLGAFMVSGLLLYITAVGNSVENQYKAMAVVSSIGAKTVHEAENGVPSHDTVNELGSTPPGATGGPNSNSGTYVPPPARPFYVGSITMDIERGCYEDFYGSEVSETVFVNDIALVLTSESGGEVKMVLDVEGLHGANPQSYSVTVQKGNTYYQVQRNKAEPGPVFIVSTPPSWEGHDSYRVRVRVTSPNNIATNWFVSPARASGSPCVPS